MITDHLYLSSSLRVETLSFEEAADFNPQSSIQLIAMSFQGPDKA